ncbi:trace amine-associated receptor 1-like [Orbicella faveolata]|uniref:trace amine-associated receptor 1-like n=1 Tax=Orbicella faveolata TaxID=48498 RepID=UPI0009E2E12C|nr:trace amine-associated receptor 1-like [Orbicella faveolata]
MVNNTSHKQEPLYTEIAKLVPLSFAIVITNLLVVLLFFKRRQLRTLPNYPLLSLAVCDFITGFVNIPMLIISMHMLTREIIPKQTKISLNYLVLVLHALTSTSTVYHILIVIAEKYFAVVWPLRHRSLTKKTMLTVLAAVWLLSLVIAFIPFSWINFSHKPIVRKFFVGYGIVCLVLVFFVSYMFIVYALVVMFRTISGKTKQRTLIRRNSRSGQLTNNRRRVCIIFAVMATVFAVCWLPWFMLSLLVNLQVQVENLESFMEWFVPFRYLTSIINPLLYTFFKPDFRLALKELLWNKIVLKYSCLRPSRFRLTVRSSRNHVDVPMMKRETGIAESSFVSSV